MKDLGRMTIAAVAIALTGQETPLTAYELQRNCQYFGVSSPGRVFSVARWMIEAGDWTLDADDGRWTRRRLALTPRFLETIAGRILADLEAATLLSTAADGAIRALRRDAGLVRLFLIRAALTSAGQPDAFHPREMPIANLFMQREAGMLMLFDLAGQSPAGGARLISSAPFSRRALAQRFDVSRAHVNGLFGEAAAAGYVSLPSADRIAFPPTTSLALERLLALLFQLWLVAGAAPEFDA
jgi:hypothetical protein